MNKLLLVYRILRAVVYVFLVYSRAIGGIFYNSMDRSIHEVEYVVEMQRRGSILKRR